MTKLGAIAACFLLCAGCGYPSEEQATRFIQSLETRDAARGGRVTAFLARLRAPDSPANSKVLLLVLKALEKHAEDPDILRALVEARGESEFQMEFCASIGRLSKNVRIQAQIARHPRGKGLLEGCSGLGFDVVSADAGASEISRDLVSDDALLGKWCAPDVSFQFFSPPLAGAAFDRLVGRDIFIGSNWKTEGSTLILESSDRTERWQFEIMGDTLRVRSASGTEHVLGRPKALQAVQSPNRVKALEGRWQSGRKHYWFRRDGRGEFSGFDVFAEGTWSADEHHLTFWTGSSATTDEYWLAGAELILRDQCGDEYVYKRVRKGR